MDANTYRVLEAAVRMAGMSEGAFDPCAAPPACEAARGSGGWRDIELVDGHFTEPEAFGFFEAPIEGFFVI